MVESVGFCEWAIKAGNAEYICQNIEQAVCNVLSFAVGKGFLEYEVQCRCYDSFRDISLFRKQSSQKRSMVEGSTHLRSKSAYNKDAVLAQRCTKALKTTVTEQAEVFIAVAWEGQFIEALSPSAIVGWCRLTCRSPLWLALASTLEFLNGSF